MLVLSLMNNVHFDSVFEQRVNLEFVVFVMVSTSLQKTGKDYVADKSILALEFSYSINFRAANFNFNTM